jgi:Electron transfer flavoprotein, beta subunit
LNIVVAIKQIPDLQQMRIRDRKPVFDNVPFTFGTIDKNALEAAVQIKESLEAHVTALCAGSAELEDTIKEALAAGADEARMIVHEGELESALSARLIAENIKDMGRVELILFGEGSGDNYSSQVGSRVAEILGLPQINYATKIEIQDGYALVNRSLEDSDELIKVKLPAVISVAAGLNTPRIPSVMQILKAGKKPKEIVETSELTISSIDSLITTKSNLAPEMQRQLIQLGSAEELLQYLNQEGFIGGE